MGKVLKTLVKLGRGGEEVVAAVDGRNLLAPRDAQLQKLNVQTQRVLAVLNDVGSAGRWRCVG